MSIRQDKIKLLQKQQKELKGKKPSVPNLQVQQQALRRGLLLKKPILEDRTAKIKRFKENQKVARDLALQRKREKEKQQRVVNEIARRNKRIKEDGMFFPFSFKFFQKKN